MFPIVIVFFIIVVILAFTAKGGKKTAIRNFYQRQGAAVSGISSSQVGHSTVYQVSYIDAENRSHQAAVMVDNWGSRVIVMNDQPFAEDTPAEYSGGALPPDIENMPDGEKLVAMDFETEDYADEVPALFTPPPSVPPALPSTRAPEAAALDLAGQLEALRREVGLLRGEVNGLKARIIPPESDKIKPL